MFSSYLLGIVPILPSEEGVQETRYGSRQITCHSFGANAAWLEIILTANDLVTWAKLLGFPDQPEIARCEIATFRYRVLHVAARITRGARQLRLRIDATWRWATAITTAWHRIRAAFP
ncbi:hypothetical protein LAUMK35_02875 [Mycobacterium pseudokansasii]|uniref:Transposase DDE domain-containing protein n=1 Tax=Mycobacterium pseudokansasii TaxID=2341080 RepID=A0A498QP28_9MYCO|nr:hypothetical protein A4G27_27270 [Mycobacterium kansasii]VAZ95157.1 hypothetical protein LAUMK35_02875 [Mycobacterium pseudokansasii]VAZ96338.1 hypothetical protein LAUMK21_02875 [Mycobacterium pseudokansasii]VBA50724.1 hypothetical protein LAUMK142_02777 [Mycobacterium pseudokansasii]